MALHTSTVISRKVSDILAHVSRVHLAFPDHIPLYSLSATSEVDSRNLQDLVSSVSALSPHSVGCLSAPIPSSSPALQANIACSMAMFRKDHATAFRSDIPGRSAPQVGRWHAFRKKDQTGFGTGETVQAETENVNWDDVWAKNVDVPSLPSELQAIPADEAHTIIYLSDGSPEGLSNSLQALPMATKIGLIASSTPFITGRPYTLFHGKSVYSSGAVGLCIHSSSRPELHVDFPGMQALTPPMVVTESEGNLVLALDDENPSRVLLSAIESGRNFSATDDQSAKLLKVMKDDTFFLGTLEPGTSKIRQVYHIISGDPARGSLAMESDSAPSQGTKVQIFRSPAHANPNMLSRYKLSSSENGSLRRMAFAVAPSDPMHGESGDHGETVILEDTFLTASENGFVVDRHAPGGTEREQPWMCKLPGAVAELRWVSAS
ncbi:uncharacterized protein B0H18DRAFT_883271 [Fomitopsis serialis]|uniref:uncharacterized protein n=1 Tax=Fomitopsis serialis TaxID=139415 RepID=UPI002008A9DB|nr:uncharacterized protein B0H18DRAFT_883271 [Neoantrodia serialis]KAH9917967.1 hypothetical protein B0H18DRAFT_883271 [Neoantrodia serialis]